MLSGYFLLQKVRYFFVIPQSILHRGVIMKPPGWKSAIPGAAVGFFFSNSQFIYTFYKFCANNFTILVQTGTYNIAGVKNKQIKNNFAIK